MTIPDDVRERLAAVQHEIWAHWMRHLFGVSAPQLDGSVVIPPARVERWQRQMNTPYVDLTDREQESDRHQADKILATLDVSAAPDVMTMPDDVRDIIRTALECYVEYWDENDTSMDNRYSTDAHADAEIVYAWLDAQPEVPESEPMQMPEDVRNWIASAAQVASDSARYYDADSSSSDAVLAWLDAQPEAPEPERWEPVEVGEIMELDFGVQAEIGKLGAVTFADRTSGVVVQVSFPPRYRICMEVTP